MGHYGYVSEMLGAMWFERRWRGSGVWNLFASVLKTAQGNFIRGSAYRWCARRLPCSARAGRSRLASASSPAAVLVQAFVSVDVIVGPASGIRRPGLGHGRVRLLHASWYSCGSIGQSLHAARVPRKVCSADAWDFHADWCLIKGRVNQRNGRGSGRVWTRAPDMFWGRLDADLRVGAAAGRAGHYTTSSSRNVVPPPPASRVLESQSEKQHPVTCAKCAGLVVLPDVT